MRSDYMPRRPRIHVPGGVYHVILRGNGRQAIFFDNEDRHRWESLIAAGIRRYRHRIHAYCWMTTHVHMAVQCSAEPLWHFVRDLASQYARSTNKKTGHSGHFFERRHRSLLVTTSEYVLALVRYIHLNPVQAGIVRQVDDYRWSSHRAYMGNHKPEWLTTDWVLSTIGQSRRAAIKEYRWYMAASPDESISRELEQGGEFDDRILGEESIASSDACTPTQNAATLDAIIERSCVTYGTTEHELASRSRNRRCSMIRAEIALEAIDAQVATLAEVARRFGRSESVLSRTLGRLRRNKAIS